MPTRGADRIAASRFSAGKEPNRQVAHMKVHEYQAKAVLKRFGIPVPDHRVAETADEAVQ